MSNKQYIDHANPFKGTYDGESLFTDSPKEDQQEPEWITTETDVGLRAVLTALVNKETIYFNFRGEWMESVDQGRNDYDSLLRNFVSEDVHKLIYGIKNPEYTEPKQPEVFDIWQHKESKTRHIIMAYDGPMRVITRNKYKEEYECDLCEFMDHYAFTGRTINLDELGNNDDN